MEYNFVILKTKTYTSEKDLKKDLSRVNIQVNVLSLKIVSHYTFRHPKHVNFISSLILLRYVVSTYGTPAQRGQLANIRFIVSARRATECGNTEWKRGVGWESGQTRVGKEKKKENRSRRRRFSIDGRLNNSKASCPAIFKRRAPTCACGRNPWSNSASPNKCILLMERGDAFTSRIVYPALALAEAHRE